MILTGKLFKHRCRVGDVVYPPVIVTALSMEEADAEVMLYAEHLARVNGQHGGSKIRILAATEIDLEAL